MTDFLNLWSPFGPQVRGLPDAPANPERWLERRVPVDRMGYDLRRRFRPAERFPWSTLNPEAYFAAYPERLQCLTFLELDPGSQDQVGGGQGYNGGLPGMDLQRYRERVEGVKSWLGQRLKLVRYVQAGNETDFCPDVDAAGRRIEWFAHQVETLKVLRDLFPDAVLVGGGADLERQVFGQPSWNWWVAERGHPGAIGFILDVHWNDQPVEQAEGEYRAFIAAFPEVEVSCFENAAAAGKARFAALAKRLGLRTYGDVCAEFIFETWSPFARPSDRDVGRPVFGRSLEPPGSEVPEPTPPSPRAPVPTWHLGTVGFRGGEWFWSETVAASVSAAARELGTLEEDDDEVDREKIARLLDRQDKNLDKALASIVELREDGTLPDADGRRLQKQLNRVAQRADEIRDVLEG